MLFTFPLLAYHAVLAVNNDDPFIVAIRDGGWPTKRCQAEDSDGCCRWKLYRYWPDHTPWLNAKSGKPVAPVESYNVRRVDPDYVHNVKEDRAAYVYCQETRDTTTPPGSSREITIEFRLTCKPGYILEIKSVKLRYARWDGPTKVTMTDKGVCVPQTTPKPAATSSPRKGKDHTGRTQGTMAQVRLKTQQRSEHALLMASLNRRSDQPAAVEAQTDAQEAGNRARTWLDLNEPPQDHSWFDLNQKPQEPPHR